MRLTRRLCAQHLDWMFKKHWQVQGKRVPRDSGAISELQKVGIQVKDVNEVLSPKVEKQRVEIVGFKPVVIPEDQTHPNWHNQVCHTYGNSTVLLQGLPQAQVLINAIVIDNFPQNIEENISRLQVASSVDRNVRSAILASHVYDAQQVKLPKVKLLDRPAINLPRDYGISCERRMRLLTNKLLSECEKLVGPAITSHRKLADCVDFKVTLFKDEDLLQFSVSAEKVLTSSRPIEPVKSNYNGELPNLHPVKYTVTMPKKHIYTTDNAYFPSNLVSCSHPHTVFLHFNKELVTNLHGTTVTASQFQSRTMLTAFAVAASRAKQLYGDSLTKQLPKPIVVQIIQTDGRSFHFGVLQLNTLELSGTVADRNYWFHQPTMDLFSECGYKVGRPVLEGYNKDVFRVFNAFYNNC